MTKFEYGEPTTYEITWVNGHTEKIQAHQVTWPNSMALAFGGRDDRKQRIQFHADINGQWTLQLSAWEDDIRTVRNCATEDVHLGGGL
ncbi:hypothetical protein [Roseateles sp.]|uniref:hypothetical protein n=1 Tax=Roseateles sp. TaxID=1971397 RepID=UPI002F3E2605